MKKYFLILTALFSINTLALEIDERLTMRVVKVSESKKTILINRGIEDGIVKGDHAKFFLTIGVVARGVVVKVSPTRSVWSIYRLVNSTYIRADQVMRLKITAPVKITKDESKMLVSDDSVVSVGSKDPRDLGIPLAEGAEDEKDIGLDGVRELSQGFDETVSLLQKNKEIFLSLHYSGQNFLTSPSDDSGEFKGTQTTMVFNTGIEIYMKNLKAWYSRFSLVGALSFTRNSATSSEGDNVQEAATEFGGGVNWYPLTRANKVYKFIPFGSFQVLVGSVSTTFTPGSGTQPTAGKSGDAATFGFLFGGGVKYFTPKGFGAKIHLDLKTRADSFAADAASVKWVKTNTGPVINIGFLYRF